MAGTRWGEGYPDPNGIPRASLSLGDDWHPDPDQLVLVRQDTMVARALESAEMGELRQLLPGACCATIVSRPYTETIRSLNRTA